MDEIELFACAYTKGPHNRGGGHEGIQSTCGVQTRALKLWIIMCKFAPCSPSAITFMVRGGPTSAEHHVAARNSDHAAGTIHMKPRPACTREKWHLQHLVMVSHTVCAVVPLALLGCHTHVASVSIHS